MDFGDDKPLSTPITHHVMMKLKGPNTAGGIGNLPFLSLGFLIS